MLIRRPAAIRPSEITPESVYLNRRALLTGALAGGAVAALAPLRAAGEDPPAPSLAYERNASYSVTDAPNTFEQITHYNNFYEFGTDKTDPSRYAASLRTRPWSVTISGEAEKTGTFTLEDILRPHALQERVYRLRCVEAWSMVIPWIGFPLGDLLKRFSPTSKAKFVEFTSLADRRQMPGLNSDVLPWPYVEGLRMDEAVNPLAILAVGLYGRVLPNQNGAPLRLVVPWKYGFKGIKGITKLRFVEKEPPTTWSRMNSQEYGFYANVNPAVDHPRWSQAKERRIGEFFKRNTLPFNGYADQVAHLYDGMDPRKLY